MSERGFSLVELLIAMAITTTTAGTLLSLVVAGQGIARVQPEAADLQQRARIVTQVLATELARAGAGLDSGAAAGALPQWFAPVSIPADGGLTIWYVSGAGGQGVLAAPLEQGGLSATLALPPECATAAACGFAENTTALLFDNVGCHDLVRVEAVAGASLVVRPAVRTCSYAAGATIAQGEVRTYRVDAGTRTLLRRDEATGISVPAADNVSAMTVECLDAGTHIRLALRFVAAQGLRVPDLLLTVDARPPNLQVP